ncbi:ABC transporter substrate-binding protein [Ruegeria halocynthiae]|uniref:ABC transporter substrate-binding protein n=1 Tax=Ruegeria halocynthiae TaxID=985054 RepID=UPI00056CAD2C|nr:ABC transporter substrate-binding protein [Ruegeria halocynthiae]
MRFHHIANLLAVVLIVLARPAQSLDIEAEKHFPAVFDGAELHILSTADLDIFTPIITGFQHDNPEISVHYTVASSLEVFNAVYTDSGRFDLVISSAMDLQTKLVNDGYAQSYDSSQITGLPDWAGWRNQIFAFTMEPAVLLISKVALDGLPVPSNRSDLIRILRENPERFRGKIGTYDIRSSGLGYLFATQDSRSSESFWQLMELMGQLDVRLFCCSSDMIARVESGELAIAYNVLGSYSNAQTSPLEQNVQVVSLTDFSTIMVRTALIPATSKNAAVSGKMIDFLANLDKHPDIIDATGFSSIKGSNLTGGESLNTIKLGPNLLVFLDKLKRLRFIDAWESSIEQH